MSDIFREVDEDLRRDRLAQIWKNYGGLIIAGAVAVVLATAGTTAWRNWQASRAAEQTTALVGAIDRASSAPGAAADALAALVPQLGNGRAVVARLHEAGLRATAGDREAAVRLYDAIAASDAEAVYRDLATLLSVMNQLETGDPAALKGRLGPLSQPGGAWRHSARELEGLLAIRTGDTAEAGRIFRGLADDAEAPAGLRGRAAELAALNGDAK
ncbi:tetratricopeptide repeat protein [Arenibaculum pallidiluteum]|uniref:tetratricopeptide repeat protein n=1 Tax=Arenibaculum pallidiluteum TaxID=2812559 RepID=UPI001A96FA04|nr:tetratricopeptide repeat protein [Arenibaculum pallidiluteum]